MEMRFVSLATATAKIAGKPWTFIGCFLMVPIWVASGPAFNFSEAWRWVINTGATTTLLMVFRIQNTRNRDEAALHARLGELSRSIRSAYERFRGTEHMTARALDNFLAEVEGRETHSA